MDDFGERFDDPEEQKERKRGVHILVSTVRPVLEEEVEKLHERGHEAELEEGLESLMRPYMELRVILQSHKSVGPSTLMFLHHSGGKIRSVERITFSEGGYATQRNMVAQEKVTEEWVKEQVTSFIQSVLERD